MISVSVVIPAYQAAPYVGSAVESVLSQTRQADEVIVVDDGSTDATAEALGRYRGRIHVIRQANAGVSAARDRGAREATGELVAFLDADDEWSPEKLEAQVPLMADPTVIASFTETLFVEEDTGRTWHVPYRLSDDIIPLLLLHGCVIGNNSTVLVRRERFVTLGGYDPGLSLSADWDMWLRLAEIGRFALVRRALARYRVRRGSMSRDVRLLDRDNRRVLEKFFSSEDHVSRYGSLRRMAYGRNAVVLAGSYLETGDLRRAALCLAEAAVTYPAALGRAFSFPMRRAQRILSGRDLSPVRPAPDDDRPLESDQTR